MTSIYLNRRTAPHVSTLVVATATGALALNVFLPSLPAMARYFEADYGLVQLSVSLYLTSTAVLQLLIGPASDRFGRRPVMLFSFAVFILATVAAIFAPTIYFLLVCRIFQAFAAAGMVLSRAIVRDTVSAEFAASRIGYITMGMTLVPMIGPAIGGVLDEIYGWQATFGLTLAFGILAFAVVYLDLGETNRSPSASLGAQFRAYPELLRSRLFWAYTLTAAFTSGLFFSFLGGAPYVASVLFGMSPSAYGFYFACLGLGYMFGNFVSGRYTARVGINNMMLIGNVISTVAILVAIALFAAGAAHPLALFVPAAFATIGNGFTLPSANSGIVSTRPSLAGSASGLGGALQIGGGAALSALPGLFLSPETGVYPLLLIMLAPALAAIAASLFVRVASRSNDASRP
ncbi:MAG: multidrug effflux MFS transporter [Mesorhizobium sp.]|nr:multidrug effflux MFS transporter [Mesorhizobium sp.]MCO5164299.1 multidrug effflux MFS transporter [Mesorhizobium sp.]